MEKLLQTWVFKHWRVIMTFAYVVICLFDFVLMPYLIDVMRMSQFTPAQIAEISKYNPELLTRHWGPITLQSNGAFHIAMMSIITGAVILPPGKQIASQTRKRR